MMISEVIQQGINLPQQRSLRARRKRRHEQSQCQNADRQKFSDFHDYFDLRF